ncbi:hypothetical protein [Streptomyces sp. NPDC126503]|uniref:hypothetical protein n=1 Tax=Streptomyces sp. NPDC126503 TaxID=3155315 RepID=UPI00331D13D0
MSIADRTRADLAAAGYEAAAEPIRYFESTGFFVEPSPVYNDAARVTVTAKFTSQDKYDQWNEARRLAYRLQNALIAAGYAFEDEDGVEPNCVFHAFPDCYPTQG